MTDDAVVVMSHDQPTAAATLPPATCVYFSCGRPATHVVRGGCVHEHVHTCHVCAYHADLAHQVATRGRLVCHDCADLVAVEYRHDCLIATVQIEELA